MPSQYPYRQTIRIGGRLINLDTVALLTHPLFGGRYGDASGGKNPRDGEGRKFARLIHGGEGTSAARTGASLGSDRRASRHGRNDPVDAEEPDRPTRAAPCAHPKGTEQRWLGDPSNLQRSSLDDQGT